MASRSISIITSALLCGFVLAPLFAVRRQVETFAGLGPADWSALRFTLLQALLSAFISCFLAIPAARALSRSHFLGRVLVFKLMGAPFILSVLVAILGLIAVFWPKRMGEHCFKESRNSKLFDLWPARYFISP